MNKISCIICAYNEEARIGQVLDAVAGHTLLSEVIVVDDGSQDGTAEVVKKYRNIKLISYKPNRGKSSAFITGVKNSSGNIIMMLDADLVGIERTNIKNLAEPVLSNAADVTISLRKNSLFLYRWLGIDYVSGERVFKKELIAGHFEKIKKLPSYGLESYINDLIIQNKLRVMVVPWPNVKITNKSGKIGFWKGVRGEINMVRQIIKLMTFRGVVRQIYLLRSLIKR